MGNALRFLCGSYQRPAAAEEPQALGPHGVTVESVGVSALAQDLLHFHVTSEVPRGLSKYVSSSKKAQITWYKQLLKAWSEAKPPPKSPEEAATLIIRALQKLQKANLEGLLAFYGLPLPQTTEEIFEVPPSWPQGVKFELQTLPVDQKAIGDGDGFTVYVSAVVPREAASLPQEVKEAATRRANAQAVKDFKQAKTIQEHVIAAGYRFLKVPNQGEILARKYRIRLRGIDAPEVGMPYGKEAKEELVKMIQGECLKILVYGEDKYGRCVGDVYCNGVFIQEHLLKRGCAWHYIAFDQRPEFAMWEKEARHGRKGLWSLPEPEKPWEWRKQRRNCH
ncbi:putative 38.1 kDa protein [Apostasia shenzhenica]|uniref:Putative 38.1 kDa protein n=1 Tax=Apostasia shenzhenica TaxID=1088818 RepID=A0A2I0A8I4_9ASPA|nr:putative 38.1 kDa protein [Apostasia shenzhenica]